MGSSISFAKLDMDTDGKLTGREKFPIVGNRISLSVAEQIQKEFAGLFSHWDCLDKAKIVTKHIRDSQIVVGSLNLASSDMTSLYGHEFHPPYEFHAWVMDGPFIIDMALPGVIQKGLTTFDSIGAFLVGREPVILAGTPEHRNLG